MIGQMLGPYRVLEKLGEGGMADLKNNPLLKPLEGDPRHAALFKRMRLPL